MVIKTRIATNLIFQQFRSLTMKLKILFLLITVVALQLSGCKATADVEQEPVVSTLSVSGTGDASAIPDVVDIQIGVDIIDPDPVEAVNQNTTKMNAIMTVMDSMQIPGSDIQTVYYSMWVEDVYDQDGQLTGEKRYHVTNQVNIRLRDTTQIGNLIDKATDAGATSIVGITFGVADTTELEQAALDQAIENALEKAQRIADHMGVSVGKIVNVSESGYYSPPVPYYGEKIGIGGAGAVPISQGQFSMTASVQVVYELIP
jgi:uncharacterized protein YggE